jgi:prophage regulatory protein
MKTQSEKKPVRILRAPALHEKIGLKKSQIQKLESRGQFPKRIKISERASGWIESEIDEWIAKQIARSRPDFEVSA